MKNVTIEAFIKAVDKPYFDAFLNGEICMNSLKWFRQYESENKAIGDKYEDASFAIPEKASFYWSPSGDVKDLKLINDEVKDVLIHDIHGNILSLYAVYDFVNGIHYIPKQFLSEFNHHRFCLITAPNTFISRLENEIKKKNFSPEHKLVKYFTPDSRGIKLNPFIKRDKYSYQNEARIYFQNSKDEKVIINISPLYNIACEIFPNEKKYKIFDPYGKELIIMKES